LDNTQYLKQTEIYDFYRIVLIIRYKYMFSRARVIRFYWFGKAVNLGVKKLW